MSRSARQTAAFSLFTFLDVMLCTLGALIIVLICVVRTAQMKNADEAPQNAAEIEQLVSQRETVEWRTKHLAKSREETRAQLKDRRLELSHIEEHSRRLRAQIGELELAEQKSAEGKHHQEKLDQLRTELAHVTELAAAAERDLEEARRTAQSKRPSYAVVPYEGPSQTMRRPLYIECTGERIILQPEGIEITLMDLTGPLGPGNPLAAGLRAAREYLNDYGENAVDTGEPYPLLLVRPDGVEAYYHAREAMSSWGSEFGYELIDQDWKLEFRPSPPAMADAMHLAVDEARIRQQALARAAPRYYSEKKKAQWYRASPSGGIVQESGPSDDERQSRQGWSGHSGGGGHRGRGYAGSGGGGRGSRGGGNGYDRTAGSGRYPSQNGGANLGTDSAANSETELASVYGAAASSTPGTGTGNAATGAPQGNGYGSQPGGANPGGNGAGNNMFAGGTGSGTGPAPGAGPALGMGNGAAPGTGTGSGKGSSLLGSGGGAGNSFLASGGAAPVSAGALPGAAGGRPGANDLSGGGNGAGTSGGQKPGDPISGFNGGLYGSGTATQLGAAGSQGVGGSSGAIAPGAATTGTTSAVDGATAGNGTTGGSGSGAGTDGSPNGPYAMSGDDDGQGAPANAQSNGQGIAGQTGPGKLGLQPGGNQAAGAKSGQAGGAASGAPGNPGGQAGMASATSSQSSPLAIGGQAGGMASSAGMPTSVQLGTAGQGSATSSMADKRGKNWGLPEEARHAVPISRPVRVECLPDRLVLRSDQAPSQTQEIPLTERTEDSVEDLVSAVWGRVDTWGTAGRGMYWRPQLSVAVAPGAEGRYADLKTLLADSGLEVKPADKAPVQVARPKRKIGPW
ncbi:MAG TPA: hypothetical protein VHD36_15835 [Pirellulales bacterium]|nr:hypothetical protein [Pirellulales bacterium]